MLLCCLKVVSLPWVKGHAYERPRAALWMQVARLSVTIEINGRPGYA